MEKIHKIAGGIVLTGDSSQPRILLIHRSGEKKHWGHTWCYLTEHLEPGETHQQALVRGCHDELGLKVRMISSNHIDVVKTDPEHGETFHIRLMGLVPFDGKPRLNFENKDWSFVSTKHDLTKQLPNSTNVSLIDGLHQDLKKVGIHFGAEPLSLNPSGFMFEWQRYDDDFQPK